MSIDITFLGTGGSWPSGDRNVTAIGLRLDGHVILLDCGEGTQRQLMRSNLSFMAISRIFISHFHGDHFLGIAGMVQSMALNERVDPLHIYGPPRTEEFVARLLRTGHFGLNFPVFVHDLEPGEEVRFDRFAVRPFAAEHSVPTYGYVIEEDERLGRFDRARAEELGIPPGPLYKRLHNGETVEHGGRTFSPDMVVGPPRPGMRIVYSGDTRPCPRLEEVARGADVLIHEATLGLELGEKAHEYGHSTARDAAAIAARCGVRYLFLFHLSPRYNDPAPILAEARDVFADAIVPDDLDEFTIPYADQASSNSS
ncbi:MAG: ribonuclease Z [Thermoplasmata archaeon]|nr:ribonuclease Z [Thermoplasmata archaeon]